MSYFRSFIFIGIVILFSPACKKPLAPTGAQGLQGSTGSSKVGGMSGTVMLYDEYGAQKLDQLFTVTVSIDGSNYFTSTSSDGTYTLSQVPPGIYNLSFLRRACGLIQKQQVVFTGNGNLLLGNTNVFERATFILWNATVVDTSFIPGFFTASIYYPNNYLDGYYRGLMVVLGKNPNLSLENPLSYDNLQSFIINDNKGSHSFLVEIPFEKGTKYYARFYPNIPAGTSDGYYDVRLDKKVYTNWNGPIAGVYSLTAR